MIAKEGLPGLQWSISPRQHGLSDLDGKLEQLAMDLGGAPKVGSPNSFFGSGANLMADPRSAPAWAGLPSPVSRETHSMPTHDGFRPDDGYGVKDARTATIKPDEHGSVGPTQLYSTWRAPLGAIKPGYKADMVLIDLNDVAYMPYNSAARQLVYTEAGRGVDSVIVDGRVVIRGRKVMSIDEEALRREVRDLMKSFVVDHEVIVESRKRGALPYMLEAHRRAWKSYIDVNNRFIGRTTRNIDHGLEKHLEKEYWSG